MLTVHQLIELQAQQTPDKPALLLVNGRQVSFGTFNQRANRLAHYLIEQGLQKGQVVGLHMYRNPGLYIGASAILKAGGVFVIIPPDFPEKRKEFIIHQTAMPFLITNQKVAESIPDNDAQIIRLGIDVSVRGQSGETENPGLHIAPDDPAFLVYTSGSTGEPKGVLRSHRAEIHRYHATNERFPFQADDVYAGTTAINSVAFGRQLAIVLGSGIPLLIISDAHIQNPRRFINHLIDFNITQIYLTPAMLQMFMAIQKAELRDLPHLRNCFVVGDVLTPELVRAFYDKLPQVNLMNSYGSSEVCVATDYVIPRDFSAKEHEQVPIGKPFPDAPVYILDDDLTPLPDGEVGEICIGGDSLALGYYQNPETTQERFISNPFVDDPQARLYRSGDVGYFNPDGNLILIGRKDLQIKIRGYRIHLAEIERTLRRHPDVIEAVVVSRQRSDNTPLYLVAYVQTPQETQGLELKDFLDRYLPEYMVPVYYRRLDDFPILPTGKIDRQRLTQSDLGESLPFPSPVDDPGDRMTYQILGLFRELLGNDEITSHDRFLDVGGDSLMAVELMLLLEEAFTVEIPMRLLAQNPTPREIVHWLHNHESISLSPSPLIRLREGDPGIPGAFILVPPAGSTALSNGALIRTMPAQHTIYGIHPHGFDEGEEPHQSVQAMVEFYLPPLLELERNDLILCGQCFGATVTLELARQYEAATGIQLPLIVIDGLPPMSGPTWKATWVQDPNRAHNDEFHINQVLSSQAFRGKEGRFHRTWLPHNIARRTYIGKPYMGKVLIVHSEQISTNFQRSGERHDTDSFWKWHDLFPNEPRIETVANVDHVDIIANEHEQQQVRNIIADFIASYIPV